MDIIYKFLPQPGRLDPTFDCFIHQTTLYLLKLVITAHQMLLKKLHSCLYVLTTVLVSIDQISSHLCSFIVAIQGLLSAETRTQN